MARRGWSRGDARAPRPVRPAPAASALAAAVVVLAASLAACTVEDDREHSLRTAVDQVDGVTDAQAILGQKGRVDAVSVVLDHGLGAEESLEVLSEVTDTALDQGVTTFRLEARRSLTEDDVLRVTEGFTGQDDAADVVGAWIRVVDALLGEVTYTDEPGREVIEVSATGGEVGHDVAEAARIGYGSSDTTWRFVTDRVSFTVSGRVQSRDVALFDRVQRSVSSDVLPVPARAWRLARHDSHLDLDLDVVLPGNETPRQVTLERWAEQVRPLAVVALKVSSYPGRDRWLTLGDVADGDRDVFASWSSAGRPVRGRDPMFRGWDAWWVRVARQLT